MPQSDLFDNEEKKELGLQDKTIAYGNRGTRKAYDVDEPMKRSEEMSANSQLGTRPAGSSSGGDIAKAHIRESASSVSTPSVNAQKTLIQPSRSVSSSDGGGKKPPTKNLKTTGGNDGSGGGKMGKQPKKKSVAKVVIINILKAFVVLGCIGVMAVAIIAVPIMQWVISASETDSLNLLDLDAKKISQTSIIYYKNDQGELVELQPIYGAKTNRIWVGIDEMPIYLRYAAIATEDRSFETHNGFSVIRTIRAGFNKIFKTGPVYGASTIDQQLVKNLTGDDEVDGMDGIKRKALEIYRAWTLEKNYSKDTIMEAYLNTIPLSGTLVGVYTGAQQYFNKEPADLTIAECAMIVGITNAPGKYDPYKNPENCLTRRNYVLSSMYGEGYITEAEYEEAKNSPLGLYTGEGEEEVTSSSNYTVNSYFVDTLYDEVVQGLVDNGIASDLNEASYMYYNGGLRIIATIDPAVQDAIEEIYEKGYGNQADGYIFPELTAPKVEYKEGKLVEVPGEVDYTQSAMVVADYNGALKGIVGGIGEKTGDRITNRGLEKTNQVGSTMKVLAAYPLGIDSGVISYSSMLEDSPSQFKGAAKYDSTTGLPLYDWPTNYGNSVSNSMMSVQTAVAKSTNTVAVRVAERVGIDNMYDFLTTSLGVTSLENEGDPNDLNYSSLVLGGMTHGISPYEMAGAAQMLGNEGIHTPMHTYEEVQDANGNILFRFNGASTQAIQPGSSFIMRELMSGVLSTGGTAAGMKPAGVNEAVAKTGTAGVTDSETDRWFLGLTPDYVSVVWWGYDLNQHISWSAAARTNPPAMAWKTVMEKLYEGKTEQNSFPQAPSDLVTEMYCADTGYLATPNCPNQQKGYYLPDYVPDTCYIHDGTEAAVVEEAA